VTTRCTHGEADLHAAGDGPETFIFGTASEDRASLVVVDDGGSAADAAASACGVEAVLGLAGDVAAAVFGECEVEDEGSFGVFAGGDAFEDLDCDAALEQLGEHDQPFEQVPAEPVDFLDCERRVPRRGARSGRAKV